MMENHKNITSTMTVVVQHNIQLVQDFPNDEIQTYQHQHHLQT